MKRIPLTQGKFALVDDEDFACVSQHKWLATKVGKKFYAGRRVQTPKGQRLLYLHRFLLNPLPGFVVDHINHDPLDNRRENLRVCTQSENMRNRTQPLASPYPGAYRTKSPNVWIASTRFKGKYNYLGTFRTAKEAHAAYQAARDQHYLEAA